MSNEIQETEPFSWSKLKDFCNKLTDEQLTQSVVLIEVDNGSIAVKYASEIGDDHYNFDDEEFSFSKDDFDPLYHFDGKYATFEEALENEAYTITPADRVYLFDQ